MKLSELDPKEVTTAEKAPSGKLKLSELDPNDIAAATPSPSTPVSDIRSTAGALAKKMDDAGDSIVSGAKDAAMGVGQGLTLGFGDEALGGLQALKDVTVGDKKLSDLAKLYREHQQENQKSWDDAKARSPWLTTGGELAGGMMLGGPLGLLGEGAEAATLGQKVLKGMSIGGAAGIGGSKGTIESNPEQIAKDALFSAGFGGAAPVALAGLGAAGKKVGSYLNDYIEDSPKLEAIATAMKKGWNNEGISGKEAGKLVDMRTRSAANEAAGKLTGLTDFTSENYGNMINDAVKAGKTYLPNADDVEIAKLVRDNTAKYSGLDRRSKELLDRYIDSFGSGNGASDAYLPSKVAGLNASELKELQMSLRPLGSDISFPGAAASKNFTNGILNDNIDSLLPADQLATNNSMYGNARGLIETLLSKGETNPDFQKLRVSDYNRDDIAAKLNDYFKDAINKAGASNDIGNKTRSQLEIFRDYAKHLKNKNVNLDVDPDSILNSVYDAAKEQAATRMEVGTKAASGKLSWVKDLLGESSAEIGNTAAMGARKIDDTAGAAIRSVYNLTDNGLRAVAQQLDQNGLGHMGAALNQALENKSAAAKNAALFTIMQNPKSRQIITGSSDGSGNSQGN